MVFRVVLADRAGALVAAHHLVDVLRRRLNAAVELAAELLAKNAYAPDEPDRVILCVDLLAERDIRPGHVTPDGIIAIGPRKMVYLDPATTGGQVIELIQYPPEGAA